MSASARRAVILLALIGIAAACAGESASTDHDAIRDSSVGVLVAGCGSSHRRGAGTVIDDSGVVVTAAHVVAGAATVDVIDQSGAESAAEVVFFDPAQDVAAVRPETAVGETTDLRSAPAAAGASGVIVVSHRERGGEADTAPSDVVDVEVLRTVVIRTTDIYHDADVERPGFEIDAAVEPGDSGAMVHFDDGGAGIVWARSTVHDDRAWAVALPRSLTDARARSALTMPVDPGPCP